MWLVLDASEGAGIYYGFKRETSLAEMRAAIENNTLTELLSWVPAKRAIASSSRRARCTPSARG